MSDGLSALESAVGSTDLVRGLIRYLYLWVHPQWDCPWTSSGVDREIKIYAGFVNKLREAPQVGLVQVADRPRSEFMRNPVYRKFIRDLKKFNKYAREQLGRRYMVWEKTRFINARNPDDVAELVDTFNLREDDQQEYVKENEQWMAKDPKYLAKTYVFGKERDTCPLGQATLWGLPNITSIVRYIGVETPEDIDPTKPNSSVAPGECYIFEREKYVEGKQ